jgi:hypothetical protein
MLNKLPISMLPYLCFGCEKCKDTKEAIFVYMYNCRHFNRVYVFSNRVLYVFDIDDYTRRPNRHFDVSTCRTIEEVPMAFAGTVSSRILSAAELLERMKACYMK